MAKEIHTVQFVSEDPNLEWETATLSSATPNPSNRFRIITKGTYVNSGKEHPFSITYQHNDGTKDTRYKYTLSTSPRIDGSYGYDKILRLNLPPLTHATKVIINNGNSLYRKFDLFTDLQNATITNLPYVKNTSSYPNPDGYHYEITAKDTEIDIKANEGYIFKENGTIKYNQQLLYNRGNATITANGTDTITFPLPKDWDWEHQSSITLSLKSVKDELVEKTGGYLNMYLTNYQELGEFSRNVLTTFGTNGVNVYNEVPYISNLHILPIAIPEDYQTEKTQVVVGNHTVSTTMTGINNNKLTVDLGTITVTKQFNNAYDYNDVKTRLVLPFTNNLDLDIKHTIGKSIHIKYNIDIPTGDTTVTLSEDGYTFLTKQINLSRKIPFITSATNQDQYAVVNAFKTIFDNQTLTAYLITEQYEPNLNNDYYETLEKGQLKDYNGNVKAHFTNNVNLPIDEYNLLNQQLESGVKIK